MNTSRGLKDALVLEQYRVLLLKAGSQSEILLGLDKKKELTTIMADQGGD